MMKTERDLVVTRNIDVSCASWSFAILPLEKAASLVATLGFSWIDVGFDHLTWTSNESIELQGRKVRERLNDFGLSVLDTFPQLPHDTNVLDETKRRANREAFKRAIDYIAGLGARGVTLKPGAVHGEAPEESFRVAAQELSYYVEIASDANLEFSIEPHVGSLVETPESTITLLEQVKGLRLTLDYSHFVMMGVPEAAVHPLLRHTRHLHIRQARRGKLQTSHGNGTICYAQILELMRTESECTSVCMEYQNSDWYDCNDIDVVSETVRTARELRFVDW